MILCKHCPFPILLVPGEDDEYRHVNTGLRTCPVLSADGRRLSTSCPSCSPSIYNEIMMHDPNCPRRTYADVADVEDFLRKYSKPGSRAFASNQKELVRKFLTHAQHYLVERYPNIVSPNAWASPERRAVELLESCTRLVDYGRLEEIQSENVEEVLTP